VTLETILPRITASIIFIIISYIISFSFQENGPRSLKLREEHRPGGGFEKRVLRRIFGPKRDEVTGGWIKLHNEALHNLYSSPSTVRTIKSRTMRWAGHVARIDEKTIAYRLLVGKPDGRDI
jgi:hypothetical protein